MLYRKINNIIEIISEQSTTIDINNLEQQLLNNQETNRQIDELDAFVDSLPEDKKQFFMRLPKIDTTQLEADIAFYKSISGEVEI